TPAWKARSISSAEGPGGDAAAASGIAAAGGGGPKGPKTFGTASASGAKLARISHQSPTASAKGASSRGVLGPRTSTYGTLPLRRSVLRAPRSDAPLTLSRRRPVRIAG